jgi:phage shock protein PspC (stress-responsive transcriptional regulator)
MCFCKTIERETVRFVALAFLLMTIFTALSLLGYIPAWAIIPLAFGFASVIYLIMTR